jgi:iron(III) transport system permease protein
MIILERALRGQARYYQQGAKGRLIPRIKLSGFQKWLPTLFCLLILTLAFFLPLAQLISWANAEIQEPTVGMVSPELFKEYISNTARIAAITAGVVIGLAVIMAQGVRITATGGKRRLARFLVRLSLLGYAMPGAVVAVGVLTFVAPIDHQVTDFLETHLGRTNPSLIFQGTIMALIYAYIVRFMAIGFNSVEASLDKVTPSMEEAARTMGAGSVRVLFRIHVPLISTGMAAGALLIFVDVMKEIPALLMLRPPFGSDTLAIWTYFLAAEAFWRAAAIPSLLILLVGLIPIVLLMRVGNHHHRTLC